jgi:UDP-N-acetylmuramate dehydrogenase
MSGMSNRPAGYNGIVKENEPLAPHTSFKIGGTARLFVEPADEESLALCLKEFSPRVILGGGSNVLFPDGEFASTVVSTLALDSITSRAENGRMILDCGAGASMESAVEFALSHNALGLESFAGLPGTAGGAAFMNARCYDVSASDVICCVRRIDPADFSFNDYVFDSDDWAYKKSPFQPGGRFAGSVITRVSFALREGGREQIAEAKETAARCVADREQKGHFRFPSAGSVFKNNRAFGKPAGRLIDEAGLKGTRAGGAEIAPWHGNIIVNTGGATASDVKTLIALASAEVERKFGFSLENEIIVLE